MKKIIIAVLCLSMGWAAAQKKKAVASNKSKSEKQNRVLWWTFRKLLYQRKNGCSTRCSLSAFWNKNKL